MCLRKRWPKQGDPLSSLLCNTVLQGALRWREKGMGICLGDLQAGCLSSLRIADDVLLFSTSLEQFRSMMCDFKKSTESVGLRIHPDKTKFLRERAKYLGQTITFEQQERTEIRSRVRAAWASFTKYEQELTSKSHLLRHRLRLFKHGHYSYADLRLWWTLERI